jgi:hypothetical protein
VTQLQAPIRTLFINALSVAMQGDLSTALASLDKEAQQLASQANYEAYVRAMSVKAELLFLDCKEQEAIEIFTKCIEPQMSSLDRETNLSLGHHRNELSMSALEFNSGQRFYDLYDRARLTGEKLFDAEATVYAFESAAEGKHYDALPTFWREVLETFRRGNWKYFRRASSRLAEEFLALGWIDGAAYHAILALDQDVAKQVAAHALLLQNPQVIDLLIQKIVQNANLKRHATVGCLILSEIADAIPDNRVPEVFRWCLQKGTLPAEKASDLNLFNGAWDAVTSIAHRLSADDAKTLINAATQHKLWLPPSFSRGHLIDAVNTAVSNVAIEELPVVADRAIPLATTLKHDLDYANSINLLCHIAQRGGTEVGARIGDKLYPTETVENAILVQVAEVFGKQLASTAQADEIAQRVASEIRNQVHRGDKNAAESGEGYGRITISSEKESISVSISSFVGLRAVLSHRKLLSDESVDVLVSAILEMIREPENIPANKTALIDCLMDLEDRFAPEVADSVFEALAPIAVGIIPEPKIMKGAGDPDNPLNRFKMNVGSFAQVQGQALHAIARLDQLNDGKYADKLDPIFTKVLTDTNAEIRRAAFGALRWLTKLSEPIIMSLLLGTRDLEPRTAEAAYVALATNKALRIPDNLWHQLIYSLTMTSKSPLSQLRRAAAYTIKSLRDQCPSELAATITDLENRLAVDICHSVRSPLAERASIEQTKKK